MDNPGLSHVQTSPVEPNAAHSTKCSLNQQTFSLNDAYEQTVQRVHQVQEDLLSLGSAARRGSLGGWGVASKAPPLQPPPSLWREMALAED